MKGIFDKLKRMSGSLFRKKQKESLEWFYKELKGNAGTKIPKNAFSPIKDPFIGGVFHYIYDPKWKDELPHWDRFPIVIPIEIYDDGFLGLNLHYLPPGLRAKLFDTLIGFSAGTSKKAYMKVSYSILKSTVKSDLFAPCIKRYLTSHIRSKIIKIDNEHWETAVYLPTAQFQKQSEKTVWGGKR